MKRFFDGPFVGLEDEGKVVVRPNYHYVWLPENGYALVNNFCFYGLVRISDGKEVVPVKYDHVDVKDGYVIVSSMGKYGVFKLDGTLIAEPIFSSPDFIPISALERRGTEMVTTYP